MASQEIIQTEVPKRLAPTKETLNLLFGLSGNQCAFPGCQQRLFNQKNKLIANVCHIESALEGGERFNKDSNNEERRSFANLLALCLEHHVETDDVEIFKVEDLRKMKDDHEKRFKGIFDPNSDQIDDAYAIEIKNALLRVEEGNKRIEDNTGRIEKGVEESNQQILLLKAKMDQLIGLGRESIASTHVGYDAKLDEILIYRTNGKPQTAIEQFHALQKGAWDKMDDRERYRLLALVGICHIDLLETESASKSFIEGLSYQPENIKAINFGILGYIIQGNDTEARNLIAKGLSIDPMHSGILSSKIRIATLGNLDEVVLMLPKEVLNDTEIAFEIARKYKEKKDYKASYKWLRIALKGKVEQKYEILSLHATYILESIFNNFKIISQQISSQVQAEAQTAVLMYSQAWDEVHGTELAVSRVWYLMNRGIAKKILGDVDGYYEDMLLAANISDGYEVQRQLLLVALELKKSNKAKEIIKKLKHSATSNQLLELSYMESVKLLSEDKVAEAEIVLGQLLEEKLPKKLNANILLDAYGVYMHLEKLDKAEECVIALEKLTPNDLSTMTVRARIDAKLGRRELKEALLAVKQKVTTEMSEPEIQILADDLARIGCHSEAAELYELIVDQTVFSPMMEKLLNYYNFIGENAKILSISSALLEKYGPIRSCSELVSYVYERIRDETKAVKTCEDYLKVYPDDQQMRLRLAAIYDRERKTDNLRFELSKFEHLDKNLSMEHQFMVSRLMLKVGLIDRARSFAYETRRQFYDKAQAHDQFFAFHLEEEKANPSTIQKTIDHVTTDCVVNLKIGTAQTDFILEDRFDGVVSRGERSLTSFEGAALIGKGVGDFVSINSKYPDQKGEILSISPKFEYAIRDSIRLIGTVFANQSSMRTFQFPESGDPLEMRNALFDMLESHGGNDNILKNHYQMGNFPISVVSQMKSKNPVNVWMDYAADPTMGIHSMCLSENFEASLQLLEQKKPIVLEIISLLMLFQVGFQDMVQKLPNPKIVVKSTVDHLHEQLDELAKVKGTQIVKMLRVNGELITEVTTKEDIDEHILFFEQILNWVENFADIVPCEAALTINDKEKQKYDETLGESCIDAILTTSHVDGLLLAEESSIRSIAKSEMMVEGLCTFQLVFGLLRMELISPDQYQDYVFRLLQLNCQILPVTIGILSRCAEFTVNNLIAPLTNGIKGLISGCMSDEHSLSVSAGLIVTIYSKSSDNFLDRGKLKEKIILHILDTLCQRFEPSFFKEKLTEIVPQLLLIVKNRDIVLNIINGYS